MRPTGSEQTVVPLMRVRVPSVCDSAFRRVLCVACLIRMCKLLWRETLSISIPAASIIKSVTYTVLVTSLGHFRARLVTFLVAFFISTSAFDRD